MKAAMEIYYTSYNFKEDFVEINRLYENYHLFILIHFHYLFLSLLLN